ncbi:P-loop containing nucleoside triphosphate hydrolase protein [Phycomyces blakesleeanus]|uniref:P-loop containing nucleoside triphosphate hydrolase protein n=1 Tax=Phycomyces blakesleeanus TaxID=4837 RepID=A0ABR3B3Y0_PHYBL
MATNGLQLAVIGGALAGARYFGGFLVDFLKKRVVVTASFDSRDESYSWVLNWLNEHPYSQRTTQFSVSTSITSSGSSSLGEDRDKRFPPVYFLPAPGIHLLMYNNRLLWLNRELSQNSAAAVTKSSLERIHISTFGRSRDVLQQLVLDAQQKFIDRDLSRTVVFAADGYGNWRRTRSRPKRPLSTIVIPPCLKTQLVSDAKEFLVSEKWYSDRGIPYRRGYLLYGTPGSGKTSFVYSLAGELGLNIYVVSLSNKGLTDDTLGELVSGTPNRCILLVEDVDAAFVHRNRADGSGTNSVTFSGLLNAIDGVAAQEGRILCMTTNHKEKLDPALIRPGRIDVRVHFENATQEQARELFTKFYPGLTETESRELSETFAARIPNLKFSMAHLQGFLMGHKGLPIRAVDEVDSWVESHKDGPPKDTSSENEPLDA